MNPTIEKLDLDGIPTHSFVAAIQHINDQGEETPETYHSLLKDLAEFEDIPEQEDARLPRYIYLYFVQELIKSGKNSDIKEVLQTATEKATTYVNNNTWVFAVAESNDEPKLDAAGNVKPKKGAKKKLAKKVYAEEIEGKELSRKEAIGILMDKVGMTSGGASTYYANLKAGRL